MLLVCVYLLLTSTSTASGDQIRLAGPGSTRCSGRVEIYHSYTWGTVCDDDWDLNDAEVVCRQLSCGTSLEAPQSARFGQGTGQIWLDDVSCSGSERSLTACQHNGFGTHNCGHGEDAGVVCSGDQIRLAGPGSTRCSGRVEIYHNNVWGTVCDDNWDTNDAKVVCRQLTCGTAVSAPQSALFGQGKGQIWLDDVSCSGSERSLTECQHRGFGTHDCGHGEDAGVVCSVDVPKPSISMNPTGEVSWGQNVGITCSVSTQVSGGTFILKKTSGSYRKTQTSSTNSATFNIPNVNFDNEGSYQCQYEKSISSQSFSSSPSDSTTLSVTVSFPKPSISMNPAGEVNWGQNVGITCLISTQALGGTFILKKTSGSYRQTQTSSTNSATFDILDVNFDNEGSYQCQYQISGSRQNFNSPLSDSVRLSVTVRLQQPSISLTSPNGELVWGPEGAEVTRSSSFVFTCSINSIYREGHFSLIFSGSNVNYTKPAVNLSASFNFPEAEYEHQGNYSCVYEVTLSGQKFSSTETAPIIVIIKLPLLLLMSSVAAGSLLLLLLVLLVVCLVRRRRRQAKQPVALALTPVAVSVENHYGDDEDEEEEEDYENVEPVSTKMKLKEQACGVEEEESDDYEQPESDEGHDYEDVDRDVNYINAEEFCHSVEDEGYDYEDVDSDVNYINAEEFCHGVEDNEEEEDDEEETSDDEDDYVNVG
ncbi:uncharacterized protein [Thunnus thynnus]|uniref:uncharacterized protein isoform X2 n=1 Tax=Thunnus thynnus TaxID=8237 RepID=UPI0035289F31